MEAQRIPNHLESQMHGMDPTELTRTSPQLKALPIIGALLWATLKQPPAPAVGDGRTNFLGY